MTAEKAIEILSDVGDINRCCEEDAEALDMAIKALEALDKLDSIIVNQLDESTDQKECMTLRWVLDKMSEVTPNG
jgi:hypothetical protein